MSVNNIGKLGIWSASLRNAEPAVAAEAAAELDELGYGALWFPAGGPDGFVEQVTALLDATRRAVIATGIVSVWTHSPLDIAKQHHQFQQQYPGRFLLGLGISHPHVVERAGLTYQRPLKKLAEFLAALDTAPTPVPVDERILASLGPKSLELAREHSLGTHPYFVPVAHTRYARQILGPGKIIGTELMVVLDTNPETARATARQHMAMYLGAPNYVNNLLRLGYSQADIDNGGSDRIVDDIVAWGDEARIGARIAEHHAAGADHICLQVLTADRRVPARAEWRQLGQVLIGR
jgi:probable F420-dependent oxidoreductase